MSYLVPKNIPSCCAYCSYNHSSLICKITMSEIDRGDEYKERLEDCPLIDVKTPHGDLVDRNKLLRRAKRESTYAWKMNLHARTETILNQFVDWLDEAPTVIESEGEK